MNAHVTLLDMSALDDEQDAARRELREAVHGFANAENALRTAVLRAHAAKLPVIEIARRVGVTRQTIYTWTKPQETAGQR